MLGNMTLGKLIEWLEAQDQDLIVKDGFGSPVYIGKYGECGDEITPIHFKCWILTGKKA